LNLARSKRLAGNNLGPDVQSPIKLILG